MESKDTMTNEQRMALITDMINQARFNFSKGSFYFILWGAILFLAAIFEFIGSNTFGGNLPFMGWPAMGILGGIISAVYSSRQYRNDPMTHLDRVYSSIWLSFFIILVILVVVMVKAHIAPGSYILIITGFPTFLTGRVLKFKPLQWGGFAFWLIGLFSLFVLPEYKVLFFAGAMILGYLVPGLMMRNQKAEDV